MGVGKHAGLSAGAQNFPGATPIGGGFRAVGSSVCRASKVVQVKGFMPLSRHKAGKHRPANPFGDYGMT